MPLNEILDSLRTAPFEELLRQHVEGEERLDVLRAVIRARRKIEADRQAIARAEAAERAERQRRDRAGQN